MDAGNGRGHDRFALRFGLMALLCMLSSAHEWMVVQLSNKPVSDSIPPDFVGWSIEHIHGSMLLRRPQFAQLMRNLQEINGGAGPNVRLGGNSAEYCAYRADATKGLAGMPQGVHELITNEDLQTYADAVPTWKGSMIVGLNFLDPHNSKLAVSHVLALTRILPDRILESIEVGNEVDMFRRHYRKTTWDFWDYIPEFRQYASDIQARVPKLRMPRIRGPSLAMPVWYDRLGRYTDRFGRRGTNWLNALSGHWYGLSGCGGNIVTVPLLMSEGVVQYPLLKIATFADTARAAGLPAHLGETNTVACSGRAGVSDAFAAALWSLDWMFGLARVGISRANFHGGPAYSYTAFMVNMAAQRAADKKMAKAKVAWDGYEKALRKWNAAVSSGTATGARPAAPQHPSTVRVAVDPPIQARALYYGALAFTAAAKNGGRLLDISSHTNCYQHNQAADPRLAAESPFMIAHALRSASAAFRVLVLNKAVLNVTGPIGDTFVRVVLPDDGLRSPEGKRLGIKGDRAYLQFLRPPSRGDIGAKDGISWSGQTFDGSTDGVPRGSKRVSSIPLEEGRYFHFSLQPASAALLTIYTQPWAVRRPAASAGDERDSAGGETDAPAVGESGPAEGGAAEAEESDELQRAPKASAGRDDRLRRLQEAPQPRSNEEVVGYAPISGEESEMGADEDDAVLAGFEEGEAADMPVWPEAQEEELRTTGDAAQQNASLWVLDDEQEVNNVLPRV